MVNPDGNHIKDQGNGALGSAGQVGMGIDQLGDGVSARRWATGAALALAEGML
jgi:hypothetical protein